MIWTFSFSTPSLIKKEQHVMELRYILFIAEEKHCCLYRYPVSQIPKVEVDIPTGS